MVGGAEYCRQIPYPFCKKSCQVTIPTLKHMRLDPIATNQTRKLTADFVAYNGNIAAQLGENTSRHHEMSEAQTCTESLKERSCQPLPRKIWNPLLGLSEGFRYPHIEVPRASFKRIQQPSVGVWQLCCSLVCPKSLCHSSGLLCVVSRKGLWSIGQPLHLCKQQTR